jgi:maltose alpha-D-glucosyltransferase / alpha-amylase
VESQLASGMSHVPGSVPVEKFRRDHADHGFLLQLGVAVPFLIEEKGAGVMPRKDFEMLHLLRDFLQWPAARRDDATEPNVPPEENMQYFGKGGDRIKMMLNFPVNQRPF